MHRFGWLVAAVAVVAAVAAGPAAHAQKPEGKKTLLAARGKVSKIDKAAKSFVVSNKKKGDTTVVWDDKTQFKKGGAGPNAAVTAGTVEDLKEGMVAQVTGKLDGNKVLATQVVVGARKAKKPAL